MIYKAKISSNHMYYLAVTIYVLANNIQLSYAYAQWDASGNVMLTVVQLLRYISYALCVSRLFFLRKTNYAYVWIGLFLLCGSIIASVSGTANSPIFYFLFFMAGVKTDFRKTVKAFFSIQLITFILYVICGITGIIGENTILQTERTRAFLGYGWVNRAAYCLLFMTIEYLYLIDYRLKLTRAIEIIAIDTFVFCMTRTMFPFLVTIGVVFIGVFYNLHKKRKKRKMTPRKEIKLYAYYYVSIIIGVLLPLLYKPGNHLWNIINQAVTGRLALAQRAIQRYGLHIWGNKVEWVGSSTLLFGLSQSKEYFYVDAGFLNLALEFGLLFVGIVAFIYFKNISMAREKSDMAMAICLFVLFTLFVFEPYVIDFAFNPFPLYYISTLGFIRNAKKKKTVETIMVADRKI